MPRITESDRVEPGALNVSTFGQGRGEFATFARAKKFAPETALAGAAMKLDISENWRPTAANINALPMPLRRYIHALEARYILAGDVQTIVNLMGEVAELQKLLAEERGGKERRRVASMPGTCQRRFSA